MPPGLQASRCMLKQKRPWRSRSSIRGGAAGCPPRFGLVAGGLVCALLLLASRADAVIVEKIAAVVNNDIILQSEVEKRMTPYRGEIDRITDNNVRQKRLEQLRKEALDSLIDERLIVQEAEHLKITVTPD